MPAVVRLVPKGVVRMRVSRAERKAANKAADAAIDLAVQSLADTRARLSQAAENLGAVYSDRLSGRLGECLAVISHIDELDRRLKEMSHVE